MLLIFHDSWGDGCHGGGWPAAVDSQDRLEARSGLEKKLYSALQKRERERENRGVELEGWVFS